MRNKTEFKTKVEDHRKNLERTVTDKAARKRLKLDPKAGPALWVVRFDVRGKDDAFRMLEHDVDAVVLNAKAGDDVHLAIYSPGGAVTAYSNAAAQVGRLRKAGLKVTAYVDEVAASGGYMMAAACDRIVATPMSFVGSIGVVAQVPIVEDGLKKLGVDFIVMTAGEKKRTIVPFKVPEKEDKDEFKKKLEDLHSAFKSHVVRHRPTVTEAEMNGDFFMASEKLGSLVDELGDSHSAMVAAYVQGRPVWRVHTQAHKSFNLRRLFGLDTLAAELADRLVARLTESRLTGIS